MWLTVNKLNVDIYKIYLLTREEPKKKKEMNNLITFFFKNVASYILSNSFTYQ